ncbi:MAG: cell division protein FtsZ [Bacteroidales bacterium]|nr:cell division protein FtsZ [Bacteroidales bacterium]
MEDNTNSALFTFDSPKGQSSYIKVIGVGGGGGNAVNHMFDRGIEGVDFIVCNTDMKALNASPVPNKIPLGDLGLGAGNKPERARKAAMDKADDIREALAHNTQMLFITAGMGGGTGTGAAPVIAEIAKSIDLDNDENKKILVVAIVTRPFSFEGKRRREQADAGIEELRKHVDSIIVINNDKLRAFGNMRISEAFGMADDVLLTAAKGIAEIITENAYVNRDFQDVNTVMEHSGTALMGTGSGRGENRAQEAIQAATTSVLLDDSDIRGAKNVLLYFTYSSEHEMTMDEQAEITDYVLDKTDGTADIIWGAGPDESLGDELKVILIATGFEKCVKQEPQQPRRFELPVDIEVPSIEPVAVEDKADDEGMAIIHRATDEVVEVAPEPIVVPENVVIPEPVAVLEPEVKPAAPEKRVFVLEDEEEVHVQATAQPVSNATHEEFKTEIDTMVDDIHIVQPEVEAPVAKEDPLAVFAPISQPKQETGRSAFENDNDVVTAADRIRRIHELLRSNPNGADIVQQMSTNQFSAEPLYEGQHSAAREASAFSMRADGTMAKNAYLYGNQPD